MYASSFVVKYLSIRIRAAGPTKDSREFTRGAGGAAAGGYGGGAARGGAPAGGRGGGGGYRPAKSAKPSQAQASQGGRPRSNSRSQQKVGSVASFRRERAPSMHKSGARGKEKSRNMEHEDESYLFQVTEG